MKTAAQPTKLNKKLVIHKETIRELTDKALANAVGALSKRCISAACTLGATCISCAPVGGACE